MDKKTSSPEESAPAHSVRWIEIGPQQAGQRLDNFLLKTLKNLPKSRLYRIIRKGEVRINKKRVKPDYRLCEGDRLRIPPLRLDPAPDSAVLPKRLLEDLERRILHEDENLLVLDKPSGLAVHSGSGLRFGAIDALRQLRPGSDIELVHRLDRDTSGCLLFALNRKTLLHLQRQLQSGEMDKIYEAIVHGCWDSRVRRIDQPLKRMTMPNGERRVFADADGQPAQTRVEVSTCLDWNGLEFSRLQLRLLSGRTHQIRVHCQSQGHPVVGDDKYGDRERDKALRRMAIRRLLLHARSLSFDDLSGQRVEVLAPLPGDFLRITADET